MCEIVACIQMLDFFLAQFLKANSESTFWKTKKRAPERCHSSGCFFLEISRKQVKCSGTVVLLNDSGLIDFSRVRNDAVPRAD